MEKIIFTPEDGEQVEFFVLEQTLLKRAVKMNSDSFRGNLPLWSESCTGSQVRLMKTCGRRSGRQSQNGKNRR